MPNRFNDTLLQPSLLAADGRSIRTISDAIALLLSHETWPSKVDRDLVLHALECAESDAEFAVAEQRFRVWAVTGGRLPVTAKPCSLESTQEQGHRPAVSAD